MEIELFFFFVERNNMPFKAYINQVNTTASRLTSRDAESMIYHQFNKPLLNPEAICGTLGRSHRPWMLP
jgi:hypothetical protein